MLPAPAFGSCIAKMERCTFGSTDQNSLWYFGDKTSGRRNAEGHVEVTGLAAGNIEPGRKYFRWPFARTEILVLRQVDFAQPVRLTRNQEVNASLRIPNPRDVIWQGKIQANRSSPLRLRLSKNTLELLPGQEIYLPVTVEWPGSYVKHGRHPVNLEIQEPTGGTITATLEVEVAFPDLQVELISDARIIMKASQPIDTQITWWNQESKISEERQWLVPNEKCERVIPTKATHFDVVSGIRTIRMTLKACVKVGADPKGFATRHRSPANRLLHHAVRSAKWKQWGDLHPPPELSNPLGLDLISRWCL